MPTDRRRLIADALGRRPRTIVEIDEGYDFEVAIVDDEWVFRFPRRSAVEATLEVEIALLPAIAPALPVDVPVFEHISRDPLYVGYRLIRGKPLVNEDAVGVRAFLEALHALDTSALPVKRPDWVAAYRDQCKEFELLVLPLLEKDRRPQAMRLFNDVESLVGFRRRSFTPTLVPPTSASATGDLPASSTGATHVWAIPRSTTPGCSMGRSPTGTSIPTSAAGLGSTTALDRGMRRTTACSRTSRRTSSAA